MYAAERNSFKQGRAQILLDQYNDFRSDLRESGAKVRKLTIEEVSALIAQLDRSRPGWDRDLYLNGVDYLLQVLGDRI